MRDYGLNKGLVQQFDTSDRRAKGAFYGFRKMFWHYLNKLGVPFYDPCCPEASTAPVGGILAVAPNDIAAGTGGAIPVTNYLTTINTDAGGDAFTLADGTFNGQQKKIQLVVDGGGDAVITPANLAGGATITMNDAGDSVTLVWSISTGEWVVVENVGSTVA